MYKYVNKKNISIDVGGISFTPYSGYTSSTPNTALDLVSNGWDFDRYYSEVLANTSNDVAGQTKTLITGTKSIYVSTTGSDGNSGESGSPFRTIQYALDYTAKYFRFGNVESNICIINVADGTYEEALVVPVFSEIHNYATVQILGNITTLDSVILYPPASTGNGISLSGDGCILSISGITLDATRVANYGNAIKLTRGAIINIERGVKLKLVSIIFGIVAYDYNTAVNFKYTSNNFTIEGVSRTVLYVADGANLDVSLVSITLVDASGTQFIYASTNAYIYFYSGSTIGSFTGKKYNIYHRALLMLDGADTMIPGSTPGTTDATASVVVY